MPPYCIQEYIRLTETLPLSWRVAVLYQSAEWKNLEFRKSKMQKIETIFYKYKKSQPSEQLRIRVQVKADKGSILLSSKLSFNPKQKNLRLAALRKYSRMMASLP